MLDAVGEVLGLGADPQAGDRDRPPAQQADEDHAREQDVGQRGVHALARLAARSGGAA